MAGNKISEMDENLQQSEWDYILYVDRSQKDEQLQTRSVL
jgi:hypothetical protein